MRLQKFLALEATSSRRKAEELILAGEVVVNGKIAEIGTCIDPEKDVVAVDGSIIPSKKIFFKKSPLILLLNKPAGCVCSHFDKYNEKNIFDFIPKEYSRKKLMFCGRLDKTTEGMVLLTDDGELAQKLTHPSFGIKKHYEAIISRPLSEKILKLMLKGVTDDGEFLKFDKIISIGSGNLKNLAFEIVLSQGKKNEIHRVFQKFGIFVKNLKRTRIGGLNLRGVASGRCRKLSEKEIKILLNNKAGSVN